MHGEMQIVFNRINNSYDSSLCLCASVRSESGLFAGMSRMMAVDGWPEGCDDGCTDGDGDGDTDCDTDCDTDTDTDSDPDGYFSGPTAYSLQPKPLHLKYFFIAAWKIPSKEVKFQYPSPLVLSMM